MSDAIATLRVGSEPAIRLYADRIEGKTKWWKDWSIPLDQAVVQVQTMGGGMGAVTLRRQETILTVAGPGVAQTRRVKGRRAIEQVAKFTAQVEAVKQARAGTGTNTGTSTGDLAL